jgi:hypothetical protein
MMKNVFLSGLIIGLLSSIWLLTLYLIGYVTFFDDLVTLFISGKSFKDTAILLSVAILIPGIGLYFGLAQYRRHRKDREFTFSKALLISLKILITGGIITVIGAIIYLHAIKRTISEFAGLVFGLAVSGIILALILSSLFRNKSQ